MERLTFNENDSYSAVEAAIHLARYAIAAPYCPGARVLDIACGEGYGSRFLASAGASAVLGVDVDEGAVERAKARFGGSSVQFLRGDATRVSDLFPAESFDLVVSLETIEHLAAPEQFLQGLKSVLRASGILIMSCPNDHWYFPDPSEGNPYHMRKYRFDEFREMSERVLGPACGWLLGSPVMGFGSVSTNADVRSSDKASQARMNEFIPLEAAFAVPAPPGLALDADCSSFFVGVWGPRKADGASAVVYPLSMRSFEPAFFPLDCRGIAEENQSLTATIRELETQIDKLTTRGAGTFQWRRLCSMYAQKVLQKTRSFLSQMRRR
jgi:spermidine synthase